MRLGKAVHRTRPQHIRQKPERTICMQLRRKHDPQEEKPMPLDAQTQAVVDSIAASGEPPMHKLSVAEARQAQLKAVAAMGGNGFELRSEEHTSELQSPDHLVCPLLLEKKNTIDTHSCHRTRP